MLTLFGTYAEFKLLLALFVGAKVAYALSSRSGTDASGGMAGVTEAFVWSTSSAIFAWRMSPSGSPLALPTESAFTTDQVGAVKIEGSMGRPHGAFGS